MLHYWQTTKIEYLKCTVCIFKKKRLIKLYTFFLQITQNAASACIGRRSWAKRCRYAKNQSLTKIPRVHFFGWIRFLAQLVFVFLATHRVAPPRPLFHSTARHITTWRALVRRRQDNRFILVIIIAKTHRTVFVVVSANTLGQKMEKNLFLSRVTIVCHHHQN